MVGGLQQGSRITPPKGQQHCCPCAAPLLTRAGTPEPMGAKHPGHPQLPVPHAMAEVEHRPSPSAPARAHVFPMWLGAPGSRQRAQKEAPNSFPIE